MQNKMLKVINENSNNNIGHNSLKNQNHNNQHQQIKTIYPSSSANALDSKIMNNNSMLNSHYGGSACGNNNFFNSQNEAKGKLINL